MTDRAVSIIADTLRTHQFRLGKRDSFPVVFFAACSGCDWSTATLGEEGWSEHADHVAAAVVDTLGGLTRAWAPVFDDDSYIDPPFHEKHERWPGDARTRAEQVADHEDASLAFRWVSGWVREPAEETP